MFDTLTRDDLYLLHTRLAITATAIHNRGMTSPVFSAGWEIGSAAHDEVVDTMFAVSAELTRRREQEPANSVTRVPGIGEAFRQLNQHRLDGCTCTPIGGSH